MTQHTPITNLCVPPHWCAASVGARVSCRVFAKSAVLFLHCPVLQDSSVAWISAGHGGSQRSGSSWHKFCVYTSITSSRGCPCNVLCNLASGSIAGVLNRLQPRQRHAQTRERPAHANLAEHATASQLAVPIQPCRTTACCDLSALGQPCQPLADFSAFLRLEPCFAGAASCSNLLAVLSLSSSSPSSFSAHSTTRRRPYR